MWPKDSHYDGPKTAYDGPKTAYDGPKTTFDGPKTAIQDGPKTAYHGKYERVAVGVSMPSPLGVRQDSFEIQWQQRAMTTI